MTKKHVCSVYVVTHLDSGRVYVGFTTKPPKSRWSAHKWESKNNQACKFFHRALAKYGPSAFNWDVYGSYSTPEEGLSAESEPETWARLVLISQAAANTTGTAMRPKLGCLQWLRRKVARRPTYPNHGTGRRLRDPFMRSRLKRLKKRISTLEHVIGQMMDNEIFLKTRVDDLEEIVFDVPRTTLAEQVDALLPKFNMAAPHGTN